MLSDSTQVTSLPLPYRPQIHVENHSLSPYVSPHMHWVDQQQLWGSYLEAVVKLEHDGLAKIGTNGCKKIKFMIKEHLQ